MFVFNITVVLFILFSISIVVSLVINYSGNLFYLFNFFIPCMLSLILNYLFILILLDDPRCVVCGLIMFAVAAVESAIGLSLILLYQRGSGHIFYNYSIDG